MGKEETLQSTRRTTRASALATTANNVEETSRKGVTYKPTINDLIYADEPLSLDDLISSFPGRHGQITEVLRHLGPLNSPMLPLFIYGGASTGKTTILLQVFRHLKRPFTYSSCVTCYSPRILFESILNQLAFHMRNEENGYSIARKCEKPSDFINFLREALVNVLDTLKGNLSKVGSKKKPGYDMGNMVYLIIDNLDLVREWDKSSTILPFLFGLYRTLGLPEVGIIVISKASPDTYYSNSGHLEPTPIYFPGYTEKDLREIFIRKQANVELYSSFLDIVLKPFCRVTRRVDELTTAFSPLFKKYCEPLDDPGSTFSKKPKQKREEAKQKLFGQLAPHISPSLNEIFEVSSADVELNAGKTKGRTSSKKLKVRDEVLDFHMSISAKYLLISAFLASRNPATLDASLFDSTGGLDGGRKKRKCSEKTLEQKEAAEQELLLKGPGTFPLERLLAIFQCITSVAEISLDEGLQDDSLGDETGKNELTSDVLLQLSSLCNANFISKGGSCPLEGSTRYQSTVSEDLALKIARSLKFPLSRYLYRR